MQLNVLFVYQLRTTQLSRWFVVFALLFVRLSIAQNNYALPQAMINPRQGDCDALRARFEALQKQAWDRFKSCMSAPQWHAGSCGNHATDCPMASGSITQVQCCSVGLQACNVDRSAQREASICESRVSKRIQKSFGPDPNLALPNPPIVNRKWLEVQKLIPLGCDYTKPEYQQKLNTLSEQAAERWRSYCSDEFGKANREVDARAAQKY